ncbi:MAG: hypothetical protein CL920_35890 [Deltaproteobacteria bacterium]|nr:hypothetical protein [Deltaproteobacteria bacterium]MBU54109.1 hypothetical protein [Deltaproteobacteria bacterium]
MRLCMFVFCLFFSMNVYADVVPPPPTDCSKGSQPTTSHAGPYCKPYTCNDVADCQPAGLVCSSITLCIETVSTQCGRVPCTLKKVLGTCADPTTCKSPAKCETGTRCVDKADPEPAKEPTTEKAQEPSKETSTEKVTEPSKEQPPEPRSEPTQPDIHTKDDAPKENAPEKTVEKVAETPVKDTKTPEVETKDKVVGEKGESQDTKEGTPSGCGCDVGGASVGWFVVLGLYFLGLIWLKRRRQSV